MNFFQLVLVINFRFETTTTTKLDFVRKLQTNNFFVYSIFEKKKKTNNDKEEYI